jgi:hypothetical protein
LVLVNVQGLVTGVFVAIVVQFAGDRPGLDCSVARTNGGVLRTTVTELAVFREISVNSGTFAVGRSPTLPLNVTPAVKAKALPSVTLLVFIVMA